MLEIFKRRTANNTLHFLDLLLEQFPFPIQRIQTDRGLEFFAEKVQLNLSEEVYKNFNINNERLQIANYQEDLILRKLKGSL